MAQEVGVRSIPNLKQFGRDLNVLSEQLSAAYHAANRKMQIVCEGWNDKVNAKFMQEFQKDEQQIDQIAARMKEFSSFIAKSCEILEMYQNIRI